MIRVTLIWLAALSVTASRPEDSAPVYRLAVQASSTISVDGKTNVNKFQCGIARYEGTDTLVFMGEQGHGVAFSRGEVKLNASTFDCGMRVMTKDFGKTIKSEEFPYIVIEFITFEKVPKFKSKEQLYRGTIGISLAGARAPVDVTCSFRKDEHGYIHLIGSHNFTFSDFKLKPPTRMMGAVKVDENLVVNFHLVLVQT